MGLEGKLFGGVRKLHDEVHDKPFIKQYSQGKVSLADHYRHLSQLLPIYEAIENKINNHEVNIEIPEELAELSHRSERIKADMAYLRPYIVKQDEAPRLTEMTKEYAAYLQSLGESADDQEVLFAHFLVRILGDLSGGQAFKGYIRALYDSRGLPVQGGVSFYEFGDDMHKRCNRWLDRLEAEDTGNRICESHAIMKRLIAKANDSFEVHIRIFDELDAPTMPGLYRRGQGYGRFFVAGAVVATLAATAIATVSYVCEEKCGF